MIKLDKEEKLMLLELIKISKNTRDVNINNVICKEMYGISLYLDYVNKTAEYRFDATIFDFQTDPDKQYNLIRNISWKIFKLISMLKYFEKNNYICLLQEAKANNSSEIGNRVRNRAVIAGEIYDLEFINKLLDINKRTIIVGQTLVDYVQNNFKTEEEIQHNVSKKIGKVTLLITLAAMIASIFFSLLNIYQISKDDLDKYIHYDIHEIKKHIEKPTKKNNLN